MTRHERFAAAALQGLIAARTNLDIEAEIETAWRYADGMEAIAKRRESRNAALEADQVEIVAHERYAFALTYGLEAAHKENGDSFTELEARAIAEAVGNYGLAVAASIETSYERCTLSGYQGTCRVYTFHVPAP